MINFRSFTDETLEIMKVAVRGGLPAFMAQPQKIKALLDSRHAQGFQKFTEGATKVRKAVGTEALKSGKAPLNEVLPFVQKSPIADPSGPFTPSLKDARAEGTSFRPFRSTRPAKETAAHVITPGIRTPYTLPPGIGQ